MRVRIVAALAGVAFLTVTLGAMSSQPIQPCAECGVPPVPTIIWPSTTTSTTTAPDTVPTTVVEDPSTTEAPTSTSAPTTAPPVRSEGVLSAGPAVAVSATPTYTG